MGAGNVQIQNHPLSRAEARDSFEQSREPQIPFPEPVEGLLSHFQTLARSSKGSPSTGSGNGVVEPMVMLGINALTVAVR